MVYPVFSAQHLSVFNSTLLLPQSALFDSQLSTTTQSHIFALIFLCVLYLILFTLNYFFFQQLFSDLLVWRIILRLTHMYNHTYIHTYIHLQYVCLYVYLHASRSSPTLQRFDFFSVSMYLKTNWNCMIWSLDSSCLFLFFLLLLYYLLCCYCVFNSRCATEKIAEPRRPRTLISSVPV